MSEDECTCKNLPKTEEFEGAIAMDCPEHDPPLKEGECECGSMDKRHPFASPGCEFHNHHCDTCHKMGICTQASCKGE